MEHSARYTIPLVPGKKYKTYQLHAAAGKGKDADYAFKCAVCQCAEWLRNRLREHEIVPAELEAIPLVFQDLKIDSLRSFRILNGYTIEVSFLKDQGIWALRITEPEVLFDDKRVRRPVIGRQFETNVGVRKTQGCVEVGVTIDCIQPVDVIEDCEVFRPQIVKMLCANPGLHEARALSGEPVAVRSKPDMKAMLTFCSRQDRTLPALLLVPPEADKDAAMDINYIRNLETADLLRKPPPQEKPRKEADWWQKAAETLSRSLVGSAHVFVLDRETAETPLRKFLPNFNAETGSLAVYPPASGLENRAYPLREILAQKEAFFRKLKQEMREWPKRNPIFTYGSVVFYKNACLMEAEQALRAAERPGSGDSGQEQAQERYESAQAEVTDLKRQVRDYETELRERDRKLKEADKRLEEADQQKTELQRQLMRDAALREAEAARHAAELDRIKKRSGYPRDKAVFQNWVQQSYPAEIQLLPAAVKEFNSTAEVDMEVLCDAICVLAEGYCRYRRNQIDTEQYKRCCHHFGDQPFEISSCGKETMRFYRQDYEANYNGGKRLMDMHLKWSRGRDFSLRVYFFYDEKARKVVIGHLPTHLPTVQDPT